MICLVRQRFLICEIKKISTDENTEQFFSQGNVEREEDQVLANLAFSHLNGMDVLIQVFQKN